MNTYVIRLLLLFFFAFHDNYSHANAVPPGFEQAAQEQLVLSEVILMGIPIGLLNIKLGSTAFRFSDPHAVFQAIEKHLNLDKSSAGRLAQYLSQDLPRHDEKSCAAQPAVADCDYLSTPTLAAIYNDFDAKVLLFTAPELIKSAASDSYLSPTVVDVENGFVHQQSLNFISSDNNRSAYLSGVGALGIDDNSYAVVNWNGTRNESYHSVQNELNLDALYYRRDFDSQYYGQVGRMDNADLSNRLGGGFSFSFFPSLSLEGVRLGKAFAYKQTNAYEITQPLNLILVNPARVEVYKANKLLGTYYLRPGPNDINTQQFPSGDYLVTLKIFEGDRLVRTQESKLSITRGRNHENESSWFWQAGTARDLDGSTSDQKKNWVTQLGYGLTFFDKYYVSAAAGAQPQSTYLELSSEMNTGVSFLASDLNLKNTLYVEGSSRGDAQNVSLNNPWLSATFTRDKRVSPHCTNTSQGQSQYLGCFETLGAYLSFSVYDVAFSLGYSRALSESMPLYDPWLSSSSSTAYASARASESYQIMANRFFTLSQYSVMLGAGLFRNVGVSSSANGVDHGAFVNITLSANPNDSYYSISQRGQRSSLNGSSSNTDLFFKKQWDNQSKDLALSASEYQQSGSNEHSRHVSLGGQVRSAHGNYNATVSQTEQLNSPDTQAQRTLSGAYASTLSLSSQGFALGPYGQGQPSGAVLAQSSGNDAQSEFSLNAAGFNTVVASGQSALLPITQYQPTPVSINPVQSQANAGFDQTQDQGTQEIFLLPGKISQRHVQTQRTVLVFVNEFTVKGQPISPQQIKNAESYSFYPNGQAAIEVKSDQRTLQVIASDGGLVQCTLPPEPVTRSINLIEEVKCESL